MNEVLHVRFKGASKPQSHFNENKCVFRGQ